MPRDRHVAFHLPPPAAIAGVLPHLVVVDERLEPDSWWPERRLERLTLFHTLSGTVTFSVAGHTVRVGAGSLVAIARDARFTERTAPRTWWHARYAMLDGPLVADLQAALERHPSAMAVHPAALPAWTTAVSTVVRLALATPRGWPPLALHHLAGVVHALTAQPAPATGAGMVERIAAAVDADLGAPWPVARLARLARCSASSFAHRFRAEAGVSPARWVRERRIDRAARLIGEGRTIADAAERAGLYDAFHLSRLYARRFGAPPSRLRRAGSLHG